LACKWHTPHAGPVFCVYTYSADGLRPLEFAASWKFARVGWTLLCHGAQAVPQWMRRGEPPPARPKDEDEGSEGPLGPQKLVFLAVKSGDAPW
jgi:hypothetical protein